MSVLNITALFNGACPKDYSASIAEIGVNAGADTWRAACDDASDYPLITDDNRESIRDWLLSFGAWDRAELDATNLDALLLQFIAGDIRDAGLSPESTDTDWIDYQRRAESGQVSGSLFRGADGSVYFYAGS